jgi:hypothetical protein
MKTLLSVLGVETSVSMCRVVLSRSYLWRQAQVCMSLARASGDPLQRRRYEDLALEFAQSAVGERDLDIAASAAFSTPKRKSNSGSTSPQK